MKKMNSSHFTADQIGKTMEKDTNLKQMETIPEADEDNLAINKSNSFLRQGSTNSKQRAVTNIDGGIPTFGLRN